MNVYELMDLIYQGDMEAFQELTQYYRPMFGGIYAEQLSWHTFLTVDDWMQECDRTLWQCVFRFRMDKDSSFTQFVRRAVKNLAVDQVRLINRKAYTAQGGLLSLDCALSDNKGTQTLNDVFADPFRLEEDVLNRAEFDYMMNRLEPILNQTDRTVLQMLYAGYRKSEISRILDIPVKRLDGLFSRCRRRLSVDRNVGDC